MKKEEFIEYLNKFTNGELAYESLINKKEYFRVNSLKVKEFKTKLECEQSKYFNLGYKYSGKKQLGRSWEYFLGYVHPQSLSSMIPPLVLNPTSEDKVLDITAAPGGKSSQMSAMMNNKGMLVANDKKEKEGALFGNITRLGVLNTIVTIRDAKDFGKKNYFTKVLVDAPCSALGGERYSHLRYVEKDSGILSKIQKRIIVSAFDSLEEEGELVYSTCTFSPMENEEVVKHLLEKRGEGELMGINLEIPHSKGLEGFEKCWRIYPQDLQSEGFFIAKIKKGSR